MTSILHDAVLYGNEKNVDAATAPAEGGDVAALTDDAWLDATFDWLDACKAARAAELPPPPKPEGMEELWCKTTMTLPQAESLQ